MVLKSRSVLSQNLDILSNQNEISSGIFGKKKSAHELNMNTSEKNNRNNPASCQKIALQLDDGIHLIPINDIVRIESNHNYVFIHLFDDRSIFLSSTLKEIDEKLANLTFIRVHNSHLINLLYLKSIQKNTTHYAVIDKNTKVPISRRRLPQLVSKLKNWALWL